ncbi:hypothetical protein CENDO_05290 [Corynebacterium endometrii]|uniref:Uncharacterized protein n=1 Tax=Corynebacterium endometrii TaxID=2488819 RepID=A0A4P7QFM9_9CORY|nr:hypothetical protein CENDO_05290 [Corynebacterium endometrii]
MLAVLTLLAIGLVSWGIFNYVDKYLSKGKKID